MKNQEQLKFSITAETPEDLPGIRKVNQAAFGRNSEAELIDLLRISSPVFISLVAKINGKVVGHILFTPVRVIGSGSQPVEGLGLGPVAVLPEVQRMGVGAALCRAGCKLAESAGYPFVVVLGHPSYYPQFGFEPAKPYGISCAYEDVPDDAFMISIFKPDVMKDVSGVAHYREEFDLVS